MDPVAKRISGLRLLVAVMLGVAAGIVGVGSYIGLSHIESSSAKYRFTTNVDAAVSKLDENFKNMDRGMRLLAQTYVEKNPSLSDWPTVALPNFYTDSGPLMKELAGADTVAFLPLVKPDDLSRYEAFFFNYWDNDPSILAAGGGGGYYSATGRGVFGTNDTANGVQYSNSPPYHDTSGHTSWGEGRRILPVSQALFKDTLGPSILGFNLYSDEEQGEAMDRLVQCVEESDFTTATQKCSATVRIAASSDTRNFLVKTDTELSYVQSHLSVPIVVGEGGTHEFVGMLGTQYSWKDLLSRIFADDISGIDIVVKCRGFTFTCRIKNGVAEITGGSQAEGYGDVASKKYAHNKVYIANAHLSSQLQIEKDDQYNLEMTFYPTEQFMADYRTNLPILVAAGGVLLILLVSLVFVGYDVAVRGQAAHKEIVLDTKRRFVRFVSHEIRTPMNAVRLGMTLFSTEIDGLGAKLAGKSLAEVMEVLQTIVADWRQIAVDVLDNTEAAVDVLNDLLNYDKIESGTLQLEFSMVPVWNVLQRTFKTFVLQAREKEIVFQLQGEMFGADASLLVGDLGNLHCVGDETRITQVLRNLISNSLKFTEKTGAVTVLAEYLPVGLPNAVIPPAPRLLGVACARAGAVRITVEDDGAGLSPAQLSDICKEGVQFNANTLQAGGGSGLGLFIGKGIAEQHGGTMRVSSEGLGLGATFVLELPLFRVEGLPPQVGDPPSISEKGAEAGEDDELMSIGPPSAPSYLLVVDDAKSNRKLLVRILQGKGYVCREAGDGQQALDVYQQMCADGTPPTAVLMDFEMPVMNGPTATKQLREMGCGSYIVGVTGNVMQADIDVFMQAGADSVLAKPMRIEIFDGMMASLGAKSSNPDVPRRHSSKVAGAGAGAGAGSALVIPKSTLNLAASLSLSRGGAWGGVRVSVDPDTQFASAHQTSVSSNHTTVRQASSPKMDNTQNV